MGVRPSLCHEDFVRPFIHDKVTKSLCRLNGLQEALWHHFGVLVTTLRPKPMKTWGNAMWVSILVPGRDKVNIHFLL
jgi:hypothetical protein